MKKKTLTLEEKLALVPSGVFYNLEKSLSKKLPNRKIEVDPVLQAADFGIKNNVYYFSVKVVVRK
jgi:hypothetical protein